MFSLAVSILQARLINYKIRPGTSTKGLRQLGCLPKAKKMDVPL